MSTFLLFVFFLVWVSLGVNYENIVMLFLWVGFTSSFPSLTWTSRRLKIVHIRRFCAYFYLLLIWISNTDASMWAFPTSNLCTSNIVSFLYTAIIEASASECLLNQIALESEYLNCRMILTDMKFILQAQVHRHTHNFREVQQCTLLSIKTGGCSEDCAYCPQSSKYDTGLKGQRLMGKDAVLQAAKEVKHFCSSWVLVLDMEGFIFALIGWE